MFIVFEVEDVIGIEPRDFDKSIREIAMRKLSAHYEGIIDEELGYVIAVLDAEIDEVGFMLPRDASVYHKARCKLLSFVPQIQEVVEGEVVEITEFGAFIRVGPTDALLHVSQIMDDYISFDKKHSELIGSKTGWRLGVGDKVRARTVAASVAGGKVGLTTRQPYLGKIEWIEQQLRPPQPQRPRQVGE